MLTIELVPVSSWYKNLRSMLTKEQWDEIRKGAYKKANYRCEICGGKGDKWPVEVHEIWEYDDKRHIQKLVGIICLCPMCHKVKHIGLAQIRGEFDMALGYLAKINQWNIKQARDYAAKQFDLWKKRNLYEWEVDISWIEEKLEMSE